MSSTTSGGTFYMKAIFSIWLSSFNARVTTFHLQAVLVQGNPRWCWLHTCWSGGLLSFLKSSFEALASGTEPSAPNYTNLHAKIVVPASLQMTIIERLKTIFHAGEQLHAWDVVQLCQNRWCIQHWVSITGHWAKYDQIQDSTQTQKQNGILCWWWQDTVPKVVHHIFSYWIYYTKHWMRVARIWKKIVDPESQIYLSKTKYWKKRRCRRVTWENIVRPPDPSWFSCDVVSCGTRFTQRRKPSYNISSTIVYS